MSVSPLVRARYSFGNLAEVLEIPDLIAVQRESFRWFVDDGLADHHLVRAGRHRHPKKDQIELADLEIFGVVRRARSPDPVSYTHLTLPTKA